MAITYCSKVLEEKTHSSLIEMCLFIWNLNYTGEPVFNLAILLLLLSRFSRVRLCATPRRQPTRLPHPWDSPGKNTGVGCHFLLQCMKGKSESEVAQSYLSLSDPMDCSPPGSSIHGIFQARVLEWSAIAFSSCPARRIHFTRKSHLTSRQSAVASLWWWGNDNQWDTASLEEQEKHKAKTCKKTRV